MDKQTMDLVTIDTSKRIVSKLTPELVACANAEVSAILEGKNIFIPTSHLSKMEGEEQKDRDKTIMEEHGLTQTTLDDLKEGFAMYEKDDEGLPVQDIGTVLRAINQNPTEAEVKDMIGEADVNENGSISFEEFVRLTANKVKDDYEKEQDLEEALKVFDKLGSGLIDVEEISNALRTLGEPIDEEDIAELVKLGERDKNNKISLYDLAAKMIAK